jgi:hypothetical protein
MDQAKSLLSYNWLQQWRNASINIAYYGALSDNCWVEVLAVLNLLRGQSIQAIFIFQPVSINSFLKSASLLFPRRFSPTTFHQTRAISIQNSTTLLQNIIWKPTNALHPKTMARGNQRDKAREKTQKELADKVRRPSFQVKQLQLIIWFFQKKKNTVPLSYSNLLFKCSIRAILADL